MVVIHIDNNSFVQPYNIEKLGIYQSFMTGEFDERFWIIALGSAQRLDPQVQFKLTKAAMERLIVPAEVTYVIKYRKHMLETECRYIPIKCKNPSAH